MVAILVCINKEETWHSAPFTLGCVTSEQDSNMFQFTIYSVAKQVWWNLKPVRCADQNSCVPAYPVSSERTPSDLQPLLKPPPVPPCWSLLQHPLTHHLILTGLFFLLSSFGIWPVRIQCARRKENKVFYSHIELSVFLFKEFNYVFVC